ncbi:MAG: 1-acyl-sn-glycerol-3-phosphate acyltransferase [Clostridia bacterium]|nr:1-acyl-sn-glycerol-3-phosphate acyltransferase [Clostridia bacterium]
MKEKQKAPQEAAEEKKPETAEQQKEAAVYNTPTGRPDLDPRKKPRKEWTKLEKWFRTLHHLQHIWNIFLPLKKHGHREYYNDGAYIIVGNHHSMCDVVPTAMSSYRPVHFMAKQEIWNVKPGAWFCEKSDAFPVARDGSDFKAMVKAMKLLKDGEMVAIYSEGTRNKTKEIFLPLKSGAASLAIKTRTPIIFCMQLSKMKSFRTHHVYYSEPFELSQYYGKKLTPELIAEADSVILEKMYENYFILDEEVNGKKDRKKLAKELKKRKKAEDKARLLAEKQAAKNPAQASSD